MDNRERIERLRIEALEAQLTELQAKYDKLNDFEQSQCVALLTKLNEKDKQLAAAVRDIHRCCDTCEWYRPSCGAIGAKKCIRSYEPSACMECVNWEWRGPQEAGEGGG